MPRKTLRALAGGAPPFRGGAKTMKLIKSFVTGVCVVAASTALAPTSAKAAMTPVTVNFATTQSSLGLAETVPLKVAIDKGMLKKQGITLKIVIVNGGVDNVQALDARKADGVRSFLLQFVQICATRPLSPDGG